MRRLALLLVALALLPGCSVSFAWQIRDCRLAYNGSILDPRVGQKNIAMGDDLTVDVYKDPVSEQAAGMVPQIAASVVRALIAHGLLSAVGDAASPGGAIDDLLEKTPDEVSPLPDTP